MKRFLSFIACVIIGITMLAGSFASGYNTHKNDDKDYQAACLYRQMLDELISHMDDREKTEAEEIIGAVLENLDCYEAITVTRYEMENNYNKNYVQ